MASKAQKTWQPDHKTIVAIKVHKTSVATQVQELWQSSTHNSQFQWWQRKSTQIPVAIIASVEIVRTVESKHPIYNELSSAAGTVWFDAPYGLLVATTAGHVSKQQQ